MKVLDPETGRLALFAFLSERSPLGAMSVLYARLGRLFQIPFRAFHPFVVGGPEANRKLLVTEREKVRWRSADPVTDLLRQGVLVTDGAEHDAYRGLMEPELHPSVLPRYVKTMLAQTDRVTAEWQDGGTVDLLVENRKIALLIIMETLFGVDVWGDLPKIWDSGAEGYRIHLSGSVDLLAANSPPGYKRHLAALDAWLYGIIRLRRDAAPRQDLLQHLIDAGLEDDRIRDQMLTMLIAGHDTSTALLAWVFYLLGRDVETYHQLVRELDEALGCEPPASPSGWQPALLDMVIKETLRLYPPIHTGNPRWWRISPLKAAPFPQGRGCSIRST